MRTVRIKVYKFKELSKEAKDKALSSLLDINVDYDWWSAVYEDAERAGLYITEFDQYYNCKGKFDDNISDAAFHCACYISENHGEESATYKVAKRYLIEHENMQKNATADNNGESFNYLDFSDIDEILLRSLLLEYGKILSNEYDYLTSESSVVETIESNDYEFTESGKLFAKQ